MTSISSHALGSSWSGPLKLELELPNEERASRGLSGKAAGLYKRLADLPSRWGRGADLGRVGLEGGLCSLRRYIEDNGGGR